MRIREIKISDYNGVDKYIEYKSLLIKKIYANLNLV